MRFRFILIGLAAGIGVVMFIGASASLHDVGFPLDDSWIHQTYARNLAEEGEWAFIPGEPSVASTSPLFTVVLSLGYVLHIPFFVWTFIVGFLALSVAGWIALALGEKMFPKLPFVGLFTGLAVVTSWHLVWAATSGMETMLFSTLSLAVIGLTWREISAQKTATRGEFRRGLSTGLVGAALTLTRPEGAGLVALAGLFVVAAQPYGSWRTEWKRYLAWGGGLALGWMAGIAPYAAMNYHISETFLPNTSAAKQAEYANLLELPLLERYGRMFLPLVIGGQLLMVPGVIVAFVILVKRIKRNRVALLYLLPAAWIFLDVSAYALRLPTAYQHGRYVMPVVPHIFLYGVGGTIAIVDRARFGPVQRVASRSLGLASALIMPAFLIMGAQVYARDVRIINTEMVTTAKWVRDHLPPNELLAVHDIGAVGYYAPRSILDLAGLVSPEVVPIIRDHEAIMEFMCTKKAQYLMVLPDQLPAISNDPRLGDLLFITNARYAKEAGAGNMAVYRLNCP
ncbi:MAG TPA: hypothetical protein VHP83_02925 [Aggregatilineaceae bacterium]|nr:hypothetical protein [Aggregatilineaceae bacterium]